MIYWVVVRVVLERLYDLFCVDELESICWLFKFRNIPWVRSGMLIDVFPELSYLHLLDDLILPHENPLVVLNDLLDLLLVENLNLVLPVLFQLYLL